MIPYNRVILTGRVATPPRCHYRPDGSPVIQFPLELDVTDDPQRQDISEAGSKPALNRAGSGPVPNPARSGRWIDVVASGKLAEFRLDLQSGQYLLVVGRLNQRTWKTPEGRNRTRTEVIATDLRTLEETK